MAIYKRGREFETRDDQAQIQQVARAGLEPGTAGLRVQRADHSATLPSWKLWIVFTFAGGSNLNPKQREQNKTF